MKKFYVCPNCGALFCETEISCPKCGFDYDDSLIKQVCASDYYVDDDGVLCKENYNVNNEIKYVYVPDIVLEIEESAFEGCEFSSVFFPKTTLRIGNGAFASCNSIVEIILPESLKEIGGSAFEKCRNLKSVVLPQELEIIEDYAFAYTGIENIDIPRSVKYIGQCAFAVSSLREIEIPSTCAEIDSGAFFNCKHLKKVVIEEGIKEIGVASFKQCTSLEDITIPNSVLRIKHSAFSRCSSIKKVKIPDNVEIIGDSAFEECALLENISIPYGIREIGAFAFCWCEQLSNIVFRKTEKYLYSVYFIPSDCDDECIEGYPIRVAAIGPWAFACCTSIESICLPEGISLIGDRAFLDCKSLEKVVLPFEVNAIGTSAFEGCSSLKEINLSYYHGVINESTFEGCTQLKEICINSNIVCTKAFYGCENLQEVVYSWGMDDASKFIKRIDAVAFSGCSALRYIAVSADAEIDDSAFEGCSTKVERIAPFTYNLKEIDIAKTIKFDFTQKHISNIYYDNNVSEHTKIPGLIEFLDNEMNYIMLYARKLLNDRYSIEFFKDIQVILSPLHETCAYSEPDIDAIISKYEKNAVSAIPIEELKKTVNSVPITDTLLGKYCPFDFNEHPAIYIFYRVLDASSTEKYLASIRHVLAHEIFHAIHHMNAHRTFIEDTFKAECVKEALADFFSFMYSIDNNMNAGRNRILADSSVEIARERYDLWIERRGSAWPYAYALYFVKNHSGLIDFMDLNNNIPNECIDKFIDIFEVSKRSMIGAYVAIQS